MQSKRLIKGSVPMHLLPACILAGLLILSCNKNDSNDQGIIPNQGFSEDFDVAGEATRKGWTFVNTSEVPGATVWKNPLVPPFVPYSGTNAINGYLWVDYTSTNAASAVISNWAISPKRILQNGDRISFYTRAELQYFRDDSTDFGNRLQVRVSISGDGAKPGQGISPGNFNILLLDINPNYAEFFYQGWLRKDPQVLEAYPHRWTKFETVVRGLAAPTEGQFAFRYFVEDAGNNGRASSVGIDKVEYIGQ